MKKFQFHLQKVIDMKEKSREQVEWSYASILSTLNHEKQKLSELIQNKNHLENQLSTGQQRGISIQEIHRVQDYLSYIELQIKGQQEQINQTERKLQEKKEELSDVKKEEKVWNNFRDKKFEEYLLETNRTEQKEMDELANYRSHY